MIIQTENLTKIYGHGETAVTALHHLNLSVDAGEFVAIMGPSGCGKSTLLHLIGGLDRATEGRVWLDGHELSKLDDTRLTEMRRRKIGFVFQFYNLIPVLTALENVELPLLLSGLSRRQRREHAAMVLRLVRLDDRLDHYPGQLSGGQQQRVAIARALAVDPTLLVADEPTGDLDRVSAEEILDMMERLNRELGKTIIMVTHDPRAAKRAKVLKHLEKGYLNDDHPQDPVSERLSQ